MRTTNGGLTQSELLNIGVESKTLSCLILTICGYRIMLSYGETVAVITPNGKRGLGPKWDYSSTTSKHRNLFLGETTIETRKKLNAGEYTLLEEM